MGAFYDIYSHFRLHFFDDGILMGAVVQETGAYVNCINALSHGRHPAFECN